MRAVRPRLTYRIAVLVVAVGTVGGACSDRSPPRTDSYPSGGFVPSPTPTSFGEGSLPRCNPPRSTPRPGWVPTDLPFPKGSYLYQDLGQASGYQRGLFVVPGPLTNLARFVLTEWPKAGWILGRGDSEEDEIETSFTRGSAQGAIKAQGQPCTPGYNEVLLVYTPDRTTTGGNSPPVQSGSPLPSPSS